MQVYKDATCTQVCLAIPSSGPNVKAMLRVLFISPHIAYTILRNKGFHREPIQKKETMLIR